MTIRLWSGGWRGASLFLGWLMLVAAFAAAQQNTAGSSEMSILDTGSSWRCHFQWLPPVYGTAADARPGEKEGDFPVTPPPAANWTQSDFDDGEWPRLPGPFHGGYGAQQSPNLALICLRGRFLATEPDQVKDLTLSASFRGGLVVYLNGKEVARDSLGAGKIAADALAKEYSLDASTTPTGAVLRVGGADVAKFKDRLDLRIRKVNVTLPKEQLRKGVNVLALEIHRAPMAPELAKLKNAAEGSWSTAGLVDAKLTAANLNGLVANVGRPKGVQVWTANALEAVYDPVGGSPSDSGSPIRIVGTRNGSHSGQAVIQADEPLAELAAVASVLAHADGKGTIPAAAVQIRYALPNGYDGVAASRFPGVKNIRRFDALAVEPLKNAQVQPVWLTVKIPSDAAPGEYRGKLTLKAANAKLIEVPIRVQVSAWTLPAPRELSSHVGLIQSPDSVALQYKVPLWSDKHFELLGTSLELLGQVGNDTVFLPLICRTHFGNEESIVRWVKQPNGTFTRDYQIFDRYLDLVEKKMGKPDVVCLYVWDMFLGGGYFGQEGNPPQGMPVSRFDPATGQVEEFVGPIFGTPESEAFVKPMLDEVRARLSKRGYKDENLLFGIGGDVRPSKAVTGLFNKVAPGIRWLLNSHGAASDINGVPVGLYAHVWGSRSVPNPAKTRLYGWKVGKQTTATFPRAGAQPLELHSDSPLGVYGVASEAHLLAGYRGFGRVGADFWPVLKGGQGGGRTILGRYPEANWHQLGVSNAFSTIVEPGPAGALSTARLEAIRHGVQEAEARIFLERALTDEATRAKLGEPLAMRCQELLDERARVIRAVLVAGRGRDSVAWPWYEGGAWLESSRQLFDAAGDVALALGQAK